MTDKEQELLNDATCTCCFNQETADEIGHFKDCPVKDKRTWWQKKQHLKSLAPPGRNLLSGL